ncbi:ABC transporter ATP-binding protein [Candidatus Thorarchaeota archaeon]|nr:MAG: ABC transporter ATP-binding protein [Candidatus Thorarchaeota archaeon]
MGMHGPGRGHGGPRGLMGTKEKRSRPIRVLLGRMVHYLGSFKRIVIVGAILSLVATIVGVINPLVLREGINSVYQIGSFDILYSLTIIFLVLAVVSWVMGGVNTWIMSIAQAGLVQSVQEDVYNHLLDADLSYHKAEQAGNVTSRVTSDATSLSTGIQVLINFASQALTLGASFVLLWLMSPFLALTSLVVVPGILFIAGLFGTVGQRIMLASQRASGEVSGQIAENLSGIHVAKAFNRETELADQLMTLNQKAYKYGFKFMILMTSMQPLMMSIGQFAIAAMLFVAGSLAVGALPILSLGDVFLGISLVRGIMFPLLGLSMMATQVQSSLAAMDRVSDVLESKPAIIDTLEAVPLLPENDGIYFKNVEFEYVKDTPVLKNVTFSINPGETVAIVGHTGAGKSTIAALVNRFYDPTNGAIFIGDQNIHDVQLHTLHSAMSLIPQEPYLFDDTIIGNIRYGKTDATDEDIIELCKIIGANEFIEVLADGYYTNVIQSGKNLSAGQRQMITIARTMLANPKILILDEATSRLDAYSESLVQDAQERLFRNRTTIVIAHRLTTIANASRILLFDHGELIEQGTHEELLEQGGLFKSLYETYYAHQGLEEITEDVVEVAKSVVTEYGGEKAVPVGAGMMMGMGMGGMGAMSGMRPSPEMMEKIKERYKSDPESIPAPFREMIKKMVEEEKKDADGKDERVRPEETIGHGGPIGSGRPSPEMMKKLLEQWKKDPDSVPAHMHDHFKRLSEKELE